MVAASLGEEEVSMTLECVGAGTKAEWRRNKSGMGQNRRVEAWAARLGGGRSVAMASSEASGPRLAFFAPRLRIVAQLEGMKKATLPPPPS